MEVTGHAHVLLAAFEKVSAVLPLDLGAMGRGVVFETRSLNLGVTPGQVGLEPEAQGRRRFPSCSRLQEDDVFPEAGP